MIERIVDFSMRFRFLVIALTVLLIGAGVYMTMRLPVDAVPDVTNIQVQINTDAPGMGAVEVEKLITFPIEASMMGLPDIDEIRSLSKTALSQVTVVFKDRVDIYFARRLVMERLQVAQAQIPKGIGTPVMGPISTGLGEIYQYAVEGDDYSPLELRTIQDWNIRYQLLTIPGVTEVNSFGGFTKQYQVLVDPDRLVAHDLSLKNIFTALEENNANVGGAYIEHASERYIVRGIGLISSIKDVENIILKARDGTPVHIKDVAKVVIGPEVRYGAVTKDGEGEVVTGIVMTLMGANARDVVNHVKKKIEDIKLSLPEGVTIKPFYDRSELIHKCIKTVTTSLIVGGGLVVLVLFGFLGNLRSAFIVAINIPLAALIAFILMKAQGISANLMSLGGLAIGIGMMADSSIVMVENIYRHLSESSNRNKNIVEITLISAKEVARPIVFAIFIIIVVFLPLFTLHGIEGKMFKPLAFTISFAMLGSLVLSLTLAPTLCSLMLKVKAQEKENFIIHLVRKPYLSLLEKALHHNRITVITAVVLLAISFGIMSRLGSEFMPQLDEGAIAVQAIRLPSISLTSSIETCKAIEKTIMSFPEVETVVSKTGRAEIATDPMGPEISDIYVILKPRRDWTVNNKDELIEKMNEELNMIPGIAYGFSQPIELRVSELISGVRSDIAIKVFGEDMSILKKKAEEIKGVISRIDGVVEPKVEQVAGLPVLQIEINRESISRYGINISDVQDVIETAIGGKVATQVLEGQKRFDLIVRYSHESRNDINSVKNILINAPAGERVPLGQLASITIEEGPAQISREHSKRRVAVECNLLGRDIGGFVSEAKEKIEKTVDLPPGYFISWGGQFELQQRANKRLTIIVPLTILIIFLLLFSSFNSLKNSALIIMNIPFAVIGGFPAMWIAGENLSVPASVGFIALFGIAVENGIIMIQYLNQLRQEGLGLHEAILKGAEDRLRPVLMTALTTALGLIPILLSHGTGSEIQKPLATVVVGGLISSTLLTLIVLPTLYGWFERKKERNMLKEKT
ncbi:MAG: efflux RND transporter permease subunit [Candidatus Scalindua sp.]|nr:efflux RND transporter permease subunit [Candidatus Scalindua sp.]MBT5306697.1 efflux RND transporter permease subunit [Candidatus Scalindua sp.]MBT6051835.1 efflux RND transporter permease subunit [Candidatus Scalindua sp.]MBT6226853.1 efflux RND transporter permease subunit [Candidatus Scalindua sp.]MBT6564758.1 efflux RND transporter permease subunit [Candidatus Scalindua sp.]